MKRTLRLLVAACAALLLIACSSSAKGSDFKDYVKNTDFKEFEYDSEHDVYIVSQDLNTIMGDESAIQNFNDSIYDILNAGSQTDKDIVFRGWNGSLPGTLVYFKQSKFNKDWSNETFDSTETYLKSNGWQSVSKFGQYQTSNDNADSSKIEEKLFEIAMKTK